MCGAVLDANVLVASALGDSLIRLAADDFYRPLWSEQILTGSSTQSCAFAPNSNQRA